MSIIFFGHHCLSHRLKNTMFIADYRYLTYIKVEFSGLFNPEIIVVCTKTY